MSTNKKNSGNTNNNFNNLNNLNNNNLNNLNNLNNNNLNNFNNNNLNNFNNNNLNNLNNNLKNKSNNKNNSNTNKKKNNNNYNYSLFNTISNNIINNKNNNKKSDSENTYLYVIVGITILCLISVSIYYYYYVVREQVVYQLEDKEFLEDILDGRDEITISSSDVPSSTYSNEYSISLWVKVDDYSYKYGDEKVILRRGEKGHGSPEVILAPKHNKLVVKVNLHNNKGNNSLDNNLLKETFKSINNNNINEKFASYGSGASGTVLAPLDNYKDVEEENNRIETFISNNEAPKESKVYQENYFNLVSGNSIIRENFESDNYNKLVFAISNILNIICSTFREISDNKSADENYKAIDNFFKLLITNSEKIKDMDDSEQVKNQFMEAIMNSEISERITHIKGMEVNVLSESDEEISEDNLKQNIELLSSVIININEDEIDMDQLISDVNNKLDSSGCELKLEGDEENIIVSNFAVKILTMMRNSIYKHIYNLAKIIESNRPELVKDSDMAETSGIGMCTVNNLPLQKWNNIIISQYNNNLSIYLDGKLVSTCVMEGHPLLTDEDVFINPDGGFSGQISRITFYNTAITQDHAHLIYKSGPVYNKSLISQIPVYVWIIIGVIILSIIIYSMFV